MSDARPAPINTTVTATWIAAHSFEVRAATGTPIAIDAGKVDGPGPVDTLLGALATCCAVDVIDILAKRRTPVTKLEVVVTAVRRGKEPKRLMAARLEFRLDGAGIEETHAERAIELAVDKYCSVASSLARDITLSSVLVLNGAPKMPRKRHPEEWGP